jgi:hypothetical protein
VLCRSFEGVLACFFQVFWSCLTPGAHTALCPFLGLGRGTHCSLPFFGLGMRRPGVALQTAANLSLLLGAPILCVCSRRCDSWYILAAVAAQCSFVGSPVTAFFWQCAV